MAGLALATIGALLLAAAGPAQAQGTGQHPSQPHTLDKFAFSAPVSFLDTGVRVVTNITTLYSTRTWVQVTVSGEAHSSRNCADPRPRPGPCRTPDPGNRRAGAAGVARAGDIIALFAPAASATTPQLRQFIKYKVATAGNPNYVATGAGTYTCAQLPASPCRPFSKPQRSLYIRLMMLSTACQACTTADTNASKQCPVARWADKDLPLAFPSPQIQQNGSPFAQVSAAELPHRHGVCAAAQRHDQRAGCVGDQRAHRGGQPQRADGRAPDAHHRPCVRPLEKHLPSVLPSSCAGADPNLCLRGTVTCWCSPIAAAAQIGAVLIVGVGWASSPSICCQQQPHACLVMLCSLHESVAPGRSLPGGSGGCAVAAQADGHQLDHARRGHAGRAVDGGRDLAALLPQQRARVYHDLHAGRPVRRPGPEAGLLRPRVAAERADDRPRAGHALLVPRRRHGVPQGLVRVYEGMLMQDRSPPRLASRRPRATGARSGTQRAPGSCRGWGAGFVGAGPEPARLTLRRLRATALPVMWSMSLPCA